MKTTVTDRQWQKWGNQNPYRGVLGVETAGLSRETKESFFLSGQYHVEHVLRMLERHFGPSLPNSNALDFGCGVGRLLPALLSRYTTVTGVDVSRSMLDEAKINTDAGSRLNLVLGLGNVGAGEVFDLVHSYIVMQHIRPKQGIRILERLFDHVSPGGVFAIHLTLGDLRLWRRIVNGVRYRVPPVHWLYNLVRRRPLSEPITEMNAYEGRVLFDLVRRKGFSPVVVEVVDQGPYVGLMLMGQRDKGTNNGSVV